MKNTNHILKVLLLITIYCFGIYASAKTVHYPSVLTVQNTNEQQDYLVNTSKVHFLHTQQAENILTSVEINVSPDFKLSFDDFCKLTFSNELQYSAKYKQYKDHLQTLRIRYRKSDLIFPFHNFW
ncbi:hypothetical protein [Winogradskyella pulchriflava]|uniref:Uncharacterized protein n=1 Tax=Winogradskyella pulchriflava TaxID=1110688 RepID=A0ABV6QA62_9FLAO